MTTESEITAGNAHPKSPGGVVDDVKEMVDRAKELFHMFDVKINDRDVNILDALGKAAKFLKAVKSLYDGLSPDQDISDVYKGVTQQLSEMSKNMRDRFESVNKLVLHVVFDNKVSVPAEQLWARLMDYYENPTKSYRNTFIQECTKIGPAVPIMTRARDLLPNILNHTKKEQLGEWDLVIYMAAIKMMFVNVEYLMIRWPQPEFAERNQAYITELNTVICDIVKLLNEKEDKKTQVPKEVETLYMDNYQALLA